MLVEFTGCTGSGKSTFLKKVRDRFADLGIETISPPRYFAEKIKLKSIRNSTAQNILMDFFAFLKNILFFKRYFKFVLFCSRVVFRKPDSFIGAVNRFRSILRKVGVYQWLNDPKLKDEIILVDEGTVHAAHNIFVYSSFPIEENDIITFAEMAPLPDIIVYLDAPEEIIVSRSINREAPPGKFEPKSRLNKYIPRALEIFRKIGSVDRVSQRLYKLQLPDNNNEKLNVCVDKIVVFILKNKSRIQELNYKDDENTGID